jgi:Spy/CpxP family protein refolding chaperone
MKLHHVAVLTLMAGMAVGACHHDADTTAAAPASGAATGASGTTVAATDDPAAMELREHHRHHHHGGITRFIAMSLDTLGTDDNKRPQIEALQHDLHVCLKPSREAEKILLGTLADGIAAGNIDGGLVDANIAQVETTSADVHNCSADALNKLHNILSPAERQALIDKVTAHWTVWRQSNHEADAGGKEKGGRLADLSIEISLTPDQVDKISTALHSSMPSIAGKFDPKKGEAHMQAFAAAFVADSFDAKSLSNNADGHVAAHGARRMAKFYQAVAPVLTADQRTALAAHIREHGSHQPTISSNP